ncbi:MAG TPA: ATP-binding protein [Trebonia sp.]|nr:ATP-binding protein [Trebonia sp.]
MIITPVLYRGAQVGWPLAAGAGIADAAAVVALILLWTLWRARAAADDAAVHREELAERQAAAFRAHEQQLQREFAELRAERARLEAECAELRESQVRSAQAVRKAVEHTVTVRLPAVLAGEPSPAADIGGVGEDLKDLLDRAVAAVAGVGDREESMRAAVVALSRRVQTSAHRLQEEATLMADRHPGDADVLEVSMRVDHAAAQQARNAQSMAVLSGEWPGQQWPEPLPLVDVVRAAAGRIIAYQRIEVAGDPDIAAAAQVVEPLIHLVAELLANATQSSPPATQVPVTVRGVQRGAVIEIHDCGVGLDEHRLALARDIAAGTRLVGLDGLGEFPQTGLPVVGQYVRRHGFRVDLSESVYGGIRAVVGVPAELVEIVAPAEAASLVTSPALVPGAREAGAGTAEARIPESRTAAGGGRRELPRRQSPRRAGIVPAVPATAGSAGTPGSSRTEQPAPVTPEEAGAWMGAFLGGQQRSAGQERTSEYPSTAGAEGTPTREEWER